MARIARIVIPGYPHHIIQRGNRKQRVFFSDNDRVMYLHLLSEHAKLHQVSIWAYCLMDNHVHMVAIPSENSSFAKAIGEVHRKYTTRINMREGWRGYLWQGRFISYPMDNKHLLSAIRYVERNPVRAGLVRYAEDYRWSSARAHIYNVEDPILSGDEMLKEEIGDWCSYLRESDREDTVCAIESCSKTGRPLGEESFILGLEQISGRFLRKKKPGPNSGDTILNYQEN